MIKAKKFSRVGKGDSRASKRCFIASENGAFSTAPADQCRFPLSVYSLITTFVGRAES